MQQSHRKNLQEARERSQIQKSLNHILKLMESLAYKDTCPYQLREKLDKAQSLLKEQGNGN